MAKRIEAEGEPSPTKEARLIGESEFNKLLRKIKTAETKLNESKGEIGSTIDAAIAKHNVHKDALRVVRKYLRKDGTAAAEFILHLDAYWGYAKLGEPEEDMVETPGERRKKLKKPDLDAEKAAEREGNVVALGAARSSRSICRRTSALPWVRPRTPHFGPAHSACRPPARTSAGSPPPMTIGWPTCWAA